MSPYKLLLVAVVLTACGESQEIKSSTNDRRSGSTSEADTAASGDATASAGKLQTDSSAPIPAASADPAATTHNVYDLTDGSEPLYSLAPDEDAPTAKYQGIAFQLLDTAATGTVALYRCTAVDKTHFLSLDSGCEGNGTDDGLMGFLYTSQQPNSVSLMRCGGPTDTNRAVDVAGGTPCTGSGTQTALGFVPQIKS